MPTEGTTEVGTPAAAAQEAIPPVQDMSPAVPSAADVSKITPTTDTTEPPGDAEPTDKPKETNEKVTAERQRDELANVAQSLINRKSREANKTLKGKTDAERKTLRKEDELVTLQDLGKLELKTYTKPLQSNENGLMITINGKQSRLVNIKSVAADSDPQKSGVRWYDQCTCTFNINGTDEEVLVTRGDLITGQIATHGNVMLDNFQGDERKAMELFFSDMKGDKEALAADKLDVNNKTIEAGAKAAGMLTADDIKTGIDKKLPEQKNPDGSALSEDQKTKQEQRQKVLDIIAGKKVLDTHDALDVLSALGTNKDSITGMQRTLKDELKRVQALPATTDTANQIADLNNQISLINQAAEAFGDQKKLEEVFTQMQEGNLDPVQSRRIIEALRTGDEVQIAEAMFDLKPDGTKQDPEIKRQQSEALKKLAKGGGFGLLALLGIILAGAFIATEKAMSAK